MSFDADLIACAQLVEKGDPDRFAATMAAPVSDREKLFPINAFNVEVSRAPWVTQESMIAEMRLQWWMDALTEIAEAQVVRRHEVVTPLASVIGSEGARMLMPLVEARRWDIYRDPFENAGALLKYIEETSAPLYLASAFAMSGKVLKPIKDLGFAAGVASYLRAVPALEQAGRIPLVDGRPDAVAELAQNGLDRLSQARKTRKTLPKSACLAAWQAGAVLKQARRDPQRVADGTLGLSEFGKRARLIWQASTGIW